VITATALLSYLAYKTLDAYKESEIEFLKSKSEQVDKASQERQTSLTNRWEPLTDEEISLLRAKLRDIPAQSFQIHCAYYGCTDIAISLDKVLEGDLGWNGDIDPGIGPLANGVTVYSGNKFAEEFTNALDLATSGRLKVKYNSVDDIRPDINKFIVVIIGRKQ